jgi:hypothetical protein
MSDVSDVRKTCNLKHISDLMFPVKRDVDSDVWLRQKLSCHEARTVAFSHTSEIFQYWTYDSIDKRLKDNLNSFSNDGCYFDVR